MQTKKLINRFHSEIKVNYFPLKIQLLLSIIVGNFFCTPSKFLLFDYRYLMPKFYLYWFLSVLVVMAVFYWAQWFNKYMDKKISWLTDFNARLLKQIIYGLVLPSLLTVAVVMILFLPFLPSGWESVGNYMRNEFRFVFLFICILNLINMVWYIISFAQFVKNQYVETENEKFELKKLLHTYEEEQQNLEAENIKEISDVVKLVSCLKVKYGYEDNYVALDGIFFIKSSAEDKRLLTLTTNKHYNHNYSLDMLMKVLDRDQYFLMYRRYIVNRSIIKGYEILDNGVLSIELKSDFDQIQDQIFVSRQDANDFKRWFDKN